MTSWNDDLNQQGLGVPLEVPYQALEFQEEVAA
jgi:hypothetical protein